MQDFKQEFMNPSSEYRPRLRYWWPGGYVANHLDELENEIRSVAEAGFGGVEISDVYDGLSEEDCLVLQPEEYGFTSENWKKSVKHALKAAEKYGIKVDLTIGPHWPATTNEATPNEKGTAKELVYGTLSFEKTLVKGTAVEELCPPHYKTSDALPDGSAIANHLIGLYLAEHVEHAETTMPPDVPWGKPYNVICDEIIFDSLTDISGIVENGHLAADVVLPHDKSLLIAVYQRGTGQRVNMFSMVSKDRPDVMAPYAYVVDHFSGKGANLIQKLWQSHLLDDEMMELLQAAGDCFFEDSLELQSVGHWTDDFLAQFEQLMGYSIKPYLPFVLGINQDKGLPAESASFRAEPEHLDKINKYRHDFFLTLNHLYLENHLKPLKEWANGLGMKYRAQTYGWAIDSANAAAHLDIAEGESLGFGEDGNDAFRMLAAGRDFGGLNILSDEAGAYMFQSYATTLPQLIHTLHKNYMAGVNQTYWHGLPFKYAPGAKWPGFAAFTPMLGGRGFAEPWGPRQPVWKYMPVYTTYLARVQAVLRYGKNRIDVLVCQNGHNATENKVNKFGECLNKLGFTYQVMTEGLAARDSVVEDNVLKVKGGSYRMVLLPENLVLPPQVHSKLLEWELAGLPILRVAGPDATAIGALNELLGDSEFGEAATNGDLLVYRREESDHAFVVYFNQGTEPVSLAAALNGGAYQEWHPWSGEIKAVLGQDLLPGELRIFEKLSDEGLVEPAIFELKRESLSKQLWKLTVENWRMDTPDDLAIHMEVAETLLTGIRPWSELPGWEQLSGVGTYSTSFALGSVLPKKVHIPNVEGSLQVEINGIVLKGNPLTGLFEINQGCLQSENTLTITVASTLNNYLNASSLGDHYGRYKTQCYGICGDVALLYLNSEI